MIYVHLDLHATMITDLFMFKNKNTQEWHRGKSLEGAKVPWGQGGRASWWGSGDEAPEAVAKLVLKLVLRACISFLKMTEKLTLITPMHENTPYFLIFLFFFFNL